MTEKDQKHKRRKAAFKQKKVCDQEMRGKELQT